MFKFKCKSIFLIRVSTPSVNTCYDSIENSSTDSSKNARVDSSSTQCANLKVTPCSNVSVEQCVDSCHYLSNVKLCTICVDHISILYRCTIRPVLRGHIWDDEKLVFFDMWPLKRGSIHMMFYDRTRKG